MPSMMLISLASDAINCPSDNWKLQPDVMPLQYLLPTLGSAMPQLGTQQLWCQQLWWWWAVLSMTVDVCSTYAARVCKHCVL